MIELMDLHSIVTTLGAILAYIAGVSMQAKGMLALGLQRHLWGSLGLVCVSAALLLAFTRI